MKKVKCKKCKKEKRSTDFYGRACDNVKPMTVCKKCHIKNVLKKRNIDEYLDYNFVYNQKPSVKKERREAARKYYQLNRERILQQRRELYAKKKKEGKRISVIFS